LQPEGLNSYFTYGVCRHLGLSWRLALTCCFIHGLLFFILSISKACNLVQRYAPPPVKKGITVGLGLFQALIGFEMMKLVVRGDHELLQMGSLDDPGLILAMLGVFLIAALFVLQMRGALLVGMVVITVCAWVLKISPKPQSYVAAPTLGGLFCQLDFSGWFSEWKTTLPVTLMFLFVAVLDTAGVQLAAGQQAGILVEGRLPGSTSAFAGASIATIVGAALGTSPIIIHNETCAGIQDGARTGLSSVVVGILFLISLFFWPILRAVPGFATAAPLIVVGLFMMANVKFIDWEEIDQALPAFLVICLIPLTYSIANGVLFGLVSFAFIQAVNYCAHRGAPPKEAAPVFVRSPTGGHEFYDPSPGRARSPYVDGNTLQPPTRQIQERRSSIPGHEGDYNPL